VVQAPRFDPAEWEVVRASVLNGLVQRDADLESVAARALARVLLQPGPTDSDIAMTVGSVAAISLDDLARAYAEMITPRTMRIQTVGDLPLAAVVAALEPRFGSSWQDDDAGLVAKPPLTPVFPAAQQVYVVAMPGTSQAAIQIARPAPGTDLPVYASAAAVTNLLAADFSGRLNTVIREQKGYSYGVSGSLWDTHATQSALTVSMPVQIDATGPALAEAFAGFASLIDQPVTAAEVTRSISAYHTLLAGLPETAGGFFGGLVGMQQDGIALDQVMARVEQMTRLDLAEVQAAATDLASLAQAVIIVAGDPERIEPQLEALGISEIGRMAVTPGDGVAIVPEAAAAAAQ
jgi:predicted Zn-dependent peptidase